LFIYERPVAFHDVDAARIVFFPTILVYCHEAIAALFAGAPGGYAAVVLERGLGLPTVHIEVDFKAPLRFGDVTRIELDVARIGESSCTFVLRIGKTGEDGQVARVRLTCVCTNLSAFCSVPWPEDLRRILEPHRPTPSGLD
jgi:4-hydroxybenzoyl-CoA thioesterase